MERPLTIPIGPLVYEVHEVARLRADDGTPLLGHILYDQCRIELEQHQAPAMKRATLWHEIIHGILENAGVSDHDERLINAVAYGICDVLQRCPHLKS